jgi:transaldolase/glucose-6-phosphate isomerase
MNMAANKLLELKEAGQFIWLDSLSRDMLKNGELERSIKEDGIGGALYSPTPFQKALEGSDIYDRSLDEMVRRGVRSERELLLNLVIDDAREAASIFTAVYQDSGGKDGYSCFEVAPDLAYDADEIVNEAERMYHECGRKNIAIKVPASEQGLEAFERLTREGINVCLTLIFSPGKYEAAAEAYMRGVAQRLGDGRSVDTVWSEATCHVSRLDTLADKVLDEKLPVAGTDVEEARVRSLYGKAGFSVARLVYRSYQEIFGGEKFKGLAQKGANPLRILWGSTLTRNQRYSEIKYMEEVIAPGTIIAAQAETLKRFREQGKIKMAFDELQEARSVIEKLSAVGITTDALVQQLEKEGIKNYSDAYFDLLEAVAIKRDKMIEKAA